jgi:DNA-binding NarL/FixJ family response regulator
MDPLRIIVVDDHPVVREGVRLVLGRVPDLTVVAETGDPGAAVALVEAHQPDVVLMDLALGIDDGVATIEVIRARVPATRVVVLTMFHDPETVRQCLAAGATGFVVKGANSSDLVDAIRAVGRGDGYVHSSVAATVIEDSLRWTREGPTLSRREHEVLSLLGGGRTPARIGEMLGISVHTVRRHLASCAAKIGVRGRDALADYAKAQGMARGEPVRTLRS